MGEDQVHLAQSRDWADPEQDSQIMGPDHPFLHRLLFIPRGLLGIDDVCLLADA